MTGQPVSDDHSRYARYRDPEDGIELSSIGELLEVIEDVARKPRVYKVHLFDRSTGERHEITDVSVRDGELYIDFDSISGRPS